MKISVLKEAIMICRNTKITPFVFGHRGLGKSSVVQQIAAANNWGFIDYRLAQIESSDLRGLPDGSNGRTQYLPPEDMPIGDLTNEQIANEIGSTPNDGDLEAERRYLSKLQKMQPRFQNGILFLDELNRAADDVLQSVFQLVLDRRIGQYILPPGWNIVTAGNFMEGYLVNGFTDPAFLDRFCHLTFSGGEATMPEWINYISAVHGEAASEVIEYASQNVDHLDGKIEGELGFSVQPSRRSWDMVIRVIKECNKGTYSPEAKLEVLAGLIGRELALTFTRYSCPVKPRQLIENGVKKHIPELKKLDRNSTTGLMWGMVSFCRSRIKEDAIATVCLDFAEFMVHNLKDKDLVVAFCRAFVGNDTQKERENAAMISNPRLAAMMAKFQKNEAGSKTFLDRLVDRPELHKAISGAAWGGSDD